MKRFIKIFILILFFAVLKAGNKIENIVFKNNDFLKVCIYLSEYSDYITKSENGVLKLKFDNIGLSENFPGSDFSSNLTLLNRIFLSKSDSNSIIINFLLNENVNYLIQNFNNSSSIVIYFYNFDKLSEENKLFIKGLEYEIKGENEKALLEYRRLLAAYPENPEALFHAGIIRKKLGFNYQAKANLSTTKKLGNNFPEVFYQLYSTLESLNDNNASIEKEHFKEALLKEKNIKIDTSIITVANHEIKIFDYDSSFIASNKTQNDSLTNLIVKNKAYERKIIKTIPVDKSSYYYSLLSTIFVISVIVIGLVSLIYIYMKKRKSKRSPKKKKFDYKEKIEDVNNNEFLKMVNVYKNQYDLISKNTIDLNNTKPNKIVNKVVKENGQNTTGVEKNITAKEESDIDKLARKYQVERGKIELALKILSKNDTESTKDKYLLLMKMLKENMSLEDLATNLRIPKGELELVMNLKNS